MNYLPPPLDGGDIFLWRLDRRRFAETWETGEGAFRLGGRWNSVGVRAVYCSLDPATAILEVAVHKTFKVLDTVPHILTAMRLHDAERVRVVRPEDVPNPNWLRPGTPSAGQQAFGDGLLQSHAFVFIPSVVSIHSWNVVFEASMGTGRYAVEFQEQFALDTRLHPS